MIETATPEKPLNPSKNSSSDARLSAEQLERFGLKSPKTAGKHYVLDTNVLLHEPGCLSRFQENHICIPADVLSEMDRFKTEQTERGANARKVHRELTAIFDSDHKVTEGVPTAGGGTIRLVIYDPSLCEQSSGNLQRFHRIFPDRDRVDHRILACTLLLQEYVDPPVVLVTKDLNMQLKARAVGITCEDYLNDKVDPQSAAKNEMARVLAQSPESAGQVELVFFDGEEAMLTNIDPKRDGLYGSRYYAAELNRRTSQPKSGILLDLVGDTRVPLLIGTDSHKRLKRQAVDAAKKLKMTNTQIKHASQPIIDDHLPLRTRGNLA
ncbi:PIN domain-containing protein, partial [bacterium]|nr:PIN domain-containing protein [bacterium]